MERNFANKLSQLKPAAESRKIARTQLKEAQDLIRFKTVEPVDYDEYVEKNESLLQKDSNKNLIVLPNDDVIVKSIQKL